MLILDAARRMEKAYEVDRLVRRKNKKLSELTHLLDVELSLNVGGVQAYFLKDKTLVVPGTNEVSEWTRFNLNTRAKTAQAFARGTGASGTKWHRGFLTHAETVYNFVRVLSPKFLIGHSLGAASVQIVGASLGKPTVAFASPRTKVGSAVFPGEGWVININRTDDTVCHVPPGGTGFRHLGSQSWMAPPSLNVGGDHKMHNYIDLLEDKDASKRVPSHWPRRRA